MPIRVTVTAVKLNPMSQFSKFERLLNAAPLNWGLSSEAPEFAALVRDLTAQVVVHSGVYKNRPSAPLALQKGVAVVALNLLRVRYSDPTRYLAFPRGQHAYRKGANPEGVGYQLMMRVFDAFKRLGYLKMVATGTYDRQKNKGFTTRVAVTEQFMACSRAHDVRSSMIRPIRPRELIELRSPQDEGRIVLLWPSDLKSKK